MEVGHVIEHRREEFERSGDHRMTKVSECSLAHVDKKRNAVCRPWRDRQCVMLLAAPP
jgi:hypothetical protein